MSSWGGRTASEAVPRTKPKAESAKRTVRAKTGCANSAIVRPAKSPGKVRFAGLRERGRGESRPPADTGEGGCALVRIPTHLCLTSSHRKNGPPIIAVMMPTGNSTGAITSRASTSHAIKNAAPSRAAAGRTIR